MPFLRKTGHALKMKSSSSMHLPVEFYDRFVPELHRNNVKIQMIGDTKKLPKETLEAWKEQKR